MITSLEIKNFKGLSNVKYDKFGLVNSIYGKNESGKSTILDCICWLLCDSTLLYGNSASNDKLININNPNELIEASLVINGNKIERSYGHKLNDDETTTDVNAYYINERRCRSQKEYFEFVDNYLGLGFKTKEKINLKYALINPFVLGKEIDQLVFRRLIKEILNVDFDKIVYESNEEKYKDIWQDYESQGKDINNLMTLYKQKIKKENSIVSDYNLQINKELTSDLDKVRLEHSNLLSKKLTLATSTSFKASDELTKKLQEIVSKNEELKVKTYNEMRNLKPIVDEKLVQEVEEIKNTTNAKIDNEYAPLRKELNTLTNNIQTNEFWLSSYDEQIATFTTQKDFVAKITCPKCGETFFDKEREERIKSIENQLNNLKKRREEIENEISKDIERLEQVKLDVEKLSKEIMDGQEKYKVKKAELDQQKLPPVFTKSQELVDLDNEIIELTNQVKEMRESEERAYQENQEKTRIEICSLDLEIVNLNSLINQIVANENLKIEKKKHLEEKAKYEMLLTIAKDYANDLAKVIKNNSNKIFGDDVDFIMLKQNKSNDEQKPVCYAQVKGIPYSSLNSANVLLTGVIVVEKIKAYLGLKDIPLLFDVVDNIGNKTLNEILDKVSSQVFYTEVDREDKVDRTLKIIK